MKERNTALFSLPVISFKKNVITSFVIYSNDNCEVFFFWNSTIFPCALNCAAEWHHLFFFFLCGGKWDNLRRSFIYSRVRCNWRLIGAPCLLDWLPLFEEVWKCHVVLIIFETVWLSWFIAWNTLLETFQWGLSFSYPRKYSKSSVYPFICLVDDLLIYEMHGQRNSVP